MNKIVKHITLFALVAFIGVLINACGDDTTTNNNNNNPPFNCFTDTNNPGSGKVRGTITFYDTNRVYTGGYYDVSAYASWPPAGPPSASTTIDLNKTNDIYKGCYELNGLSDGNGYVIVASWIKTPYGPGSVFVSAIHGCDTNATCFFGNPTIDTLPSSGTGLKGIDFNSDLDTSKMQVRF